MLDDFMFGFLSVSILSGYAIARFTVNKVLSTRNTTEGVSPLLDTSFDVEKLEREEKEYQRAVYSQVMGEAKQVRLEQAKKIMECLPDASCDSIADALGLPSLSVRLLSNGRKRGKKVHAYHVNDILDAIGEL